MSEQLDRLKAALADRYTIERELGAGGMATVYLAHDIKHDRNVAVKVLRPELAAALGADRFLNEIRVTANLQHPHILPLFDSGEANSFVYYVMPFVEGETLRDRMDRVGKLPIDAALDIAKDVAAALGYAHERGIVHRDIKPENILLEGDEALVADFGIALAVSRADQDRITATGLSLGTPAYMSPEQIGGEATVDGRSDVYSLGCVLHEMLTGDPPFTGPTVQAVVTKALVEPPPPVREKRPEVSKSLDLAIRRALAKDAGDRFPSPSAFAEACARSPESRRASKTSSIAIAIAAVAVVVLAVWGWRTAQESNARASLTEIAALAQSDRYAEAYELAANAERYLGDDETLATLMHEVSDLLTVTTEPAGARVYLQPFPGEGSTARDSVFAGETPLADYRTARVDHRVFVAQDGYAPVERLASSALMRDESLDVERRIKLHIDLQPAGGWPGEMSFVPGGPYGLVSPDVPIGLSTDLDDFAIDRFEVSNEEFRVFVTEGGYATDTYWGDEPPDRGSLVDRTGLAGPRGWAGQRFPEGQGRHPVTGVTWFEAAAYCRSRAKRLPTVYEWEKAARDGQVSHTGVMMPWGLMGSTGTSVRRANFSSDGPGPVDAFPFGISPYGVYGMAGNVKEWTANILGAGYAVTGGSWEDPTYLYTEHGSVPGMFASSALGFRCAKNVSGTSDQGAGRIDLDERTPAYTPVDRATFRSLLDYYRYDRRDANPRIVSTVETDGWTKERIWIDGVERDSILLYFYVPRASAPPYQTLVHVPGISVFCCETLDEETEWVIGPVIRGGRAVLSVVMKGMLERGFDPGWTQPPTNSVRFRDEMVRMATELRMGIDYIETRPDVDMDRLAYVSLSWGAGSRLGFAAMDERYKAVVFIGGGIDERVKPTLPEANNVNFAPYIDAPILLLNGRNDEEHPWLTRARPLWNLLPEPKELVLIDGAGHVPPLDVRIPAINDFLDKTLGPVGRASN